MKKVTLLIMMLCIYSVTFSQGKEEKTTKDDINRFRIGMKIGVPNIVDGNIEFVTPLFDNRLAPFVSYGALKYNDGDGQVKASYFEGGANVYFNNDGKGLYGSISFSKLYLDGKYEDVETIDGTEYEGVATGDVEIKTTNIKLGLKLGEKFYFRTEIGYGFGDIPQEVKIVGVESTTGIKVVDYLEIPDIPGMTENGMFLANIGFGFAF